MPDQDYSAAGAAGRTTSNTKVAIITGASSGIGAATSRLLAAEGFWVVTAARRIEELEKQAEEIRAKGGTVLPVRVDLGRLEEIESLVSKALSHFGQIDILFNNAGFGHMNWLEDLDPEQDIEAQLRVNLLGVILASRAVLPHMIGCRSGHIIQMASMASFVATPTYTIYAASKFGVRGFSQALRRETAAWGIHVSTLYAGTVRSEFKQHMGYVRKTGLTTPGRLTLSPEQVAAAVLKLIRRPRAELVIPWPMRFAALGNSLFPGLLDRLITERFVKPERGL
ncbi:MAG TPA: SDR family NAD(P)-dependent oxidoreductase [Anaerolineales bacterium]|nr:SDR family NAD(P)-dependent oxidoreductase [Anaerolineales bacterium]